MSANSSANDLVSAFLIPIQTAMIEAVIFAGKLIFGLRNSQQCAIMAVAALIMILPITLSICNFVLGLSSSQKVSGSLALVLQATIVLTAQLAIASKVTATLDANVREAARAQLHVHDDPPPPVMAVGGDIPA